MDIHDIHIQYVLIVFSFKYWRRRFKTVAADGIKQNFLIREFFKDSSYAPCYSPSHPDASCMTLRQHFHQFWVTLKHFEYWSRREINRQSICGLRVKKKFLIFITGCVTYAQYWVYHKWILRQWGKKKIWQKI